MLDSDAIKRVCEVYQIRIGKIDQAAAMRLSSLFEDYSEADLVYALEEAGQRKITNWRYIEAILESRVKKDTGNPSKFNDQGVYSRSVLRDPADILAAWTKRRQLNSKISEGLA